MRAFSSSISWITSVSVTKNIAVPSRIFNLPEMSGRESSTIMFALQVGAKSQNMTGGACTSLLQSKGQLVVS